MSKLTYRYEIRSWLSGYRLWDRLERRWYSDLELSLDAAKTLCKVENLRLGKIELRA